jgi:pyruvate dehydrogenase E1 component alpha subunit/2-oxoisovalerate dehydrogenase E1 component alpha subunit
VAVVSWSSAIATQLPQALGAAMAMRARGESEAAVAFLGDGATSHPDFHAALNFAGVFRAPVLLVCTNNQYALSVPSARQTASRSFAEKALAYGVHAVRVDGNDALAIFEVARAALGRARAGEGATLVECVTYRLGAHSSSDDPSRYRDAAEVERWSKKDPLARLSRHLARESRHRVDLDQAIDAELDREVDQALAELELEPPPPLESLFDDVFLTPTWNLTEQRGQLAVATRDVSR